MASVHPDARAAYCRPSWDSQAGGKLLQSDTNSVRYLPRDPIEFAKLKRQTEVTKACQFLCKQRPMNLTSRHDIIFATSAFSANKI